MLQSFRLPCAAIVLAGACVTVLPSCAGPRQAQEPAQGEAGQIEETNGIPTLEELQALADPNLGDLNAALNAMDAARDHYQEQPDFWQLYADASLAFAHAEQARGRNDALDVMYNDAEFAYQRLLELDPGRATAYLGLCFSRRMLGDAEGAWSTAQAALQLPAEPPLPLALRIEIGRAGLDLVIAAVQSAEPIPAAASSAEHQLQLALDGGAAGADIALADLQAWTGRNEAARQTLVRALTRDPNHAVAAERLKNLANGEQLVAAWEMVRSSRGEEALVHWRLGEALWLQYWARRRAADFLGALHSLDRAEENFLTAMAVEPTYLESCQDWLHLVRTARGWVHWSDGAVEDAADAFLSALEADPDRLEAEPVAESLSLGIYSVVGNAFSQDRLDKACAILGRLWKTHRDNPDWTNNYGFACRDLGVIRRQQGRDEEAGLLFDQAWEAYSRTVELAPEDARLINDRALISVYYLDREFELAERELHRAIELGTRQWEQMGEDVPDAERQDLDEAIGDAWENLAYLDVMRRQRSDRAEEFLTQAQLHYPFANRGGIALIRVEIEKLRSQDPDQSR